MKMHGYVYTDFGWWWVDVYRGARPHFSHRFERYEDALAWTRLKIKELTA